MAKEQAAEKAGNLNKLVMLLIGAVGLLLGTAATLALFLTGIVPVNVGEARSARAVEAPLPPPVYLPLEPPFIVNFERPGRRGFLQITIQVMTREPKVAEALEMHNPVIRNNLLLLFGSKSWSDIDHREGRERLRREALDEINSILEANGATGRLEELYFTGFVMQ